MCHNLSHFNIFTFGAIFTEAVEIGDSAIQIEADNNRVTIT